MKLQTTLVFAKDMARMTAFYRDALGLTFLAEESEPGWAVLDAGGARLALHEIPAAIAAGIAITDPPEARGDTPIKLIFAATDLDAARDRLAAGGAVVLPARRPGSFDALDPEGNVFQVQASRA
jgi:predicted enzyme related to lactoylglutathione lyase